VILINILQPKHKSGGEISVDSNAKNLRKVLTGQNPENGAFRLCFLT